MIFLPSVSSTNTPYTIDEGLTISDGSATRLAESFLIQKLVIIELATVVLRCIPKTNPLILLISVILTLQLCKALCVAGGYLK